MLKNHLGLLVAALAEAMVSNLAVGRHRARRQGAWRGIDGEYLFHFAVLSTLLAAVLAMICGTFEILVFAVEIVREGDISHQWGAELRLTVIEVVDLFLVGTVLFVIAVGLYQLFANNSVPWLRWLLSTTSVTWDGERDLLGFGVAIGAVIAGLTYFLGHQSRTPRQHEKDSTESTRS